MATYGTVNVWGTVYTLYRFPGSTFRDELNRLANGGASYPPLTSYMDENGAANKWAGITDIRNYRDIGYTLNVKYNAGRAHPDFKDVNGVCNELAGLNTSDPSKWIEGVAALRLIAS